MRDRKKEAGRERKNDGKRNMILGGREKERKWAWVEWKENAHERDKEERERERENVNVCLNSSNTATSKWDYYK